MIIVNQDKMAAAGMSRVQIKMALEKAIDKLIGNDYIEFTILDFNFEIDFKYIPSESKLNEETEEFEETKESSLVIEKVTEYNLKKLLESYGIKVEKSGISDSLYFEIDGKEYRLSDHKRPAVEDASGVFQEHEDDDFNFTEAVAMLASGLSISIQEFYCDQEAGGRAELAQIIRMVADLIENEHSNGAQLTTIICILRAWNQARTITTR